MEGKKQTAVEWVSHQLARIGVTEELIGHLITEAKEMEREQIEDAWNSASGGDAYYTGEQYYNKTYEK